MKRALLVTALLGCAASQSSGPRPRMHLGERWFEVRSTQLGMSVEQAKLRDADLDEHAPPADAFWDEQLAVEAASVWKLLCNECHGGTRSIARAIEAPGPPERWGTGDGNFFGRTRPRREVFRAIFHGIEPEGDRTEMPAWGTRLAREQIWSLIWFIEQASGEVYLVPEE